MRDQQAAMADAEQLAERVRELGCGTYLSVRVLPDATIAVLSELLFTRAICMDCDAAGYGLRFCFEDRDLATRRFHELQSSDDVPQGFVARR
jgi:hypothetical protein